MNPALCRFPCPFFFTLFMLYLLLSSLHSRVSLSSTCLLLCLWTPFFSLQLACISTFQFIFASFRSPHLLLSLSFSLSLVLLSLSPSVFLCPFSFSHPYFLITCLFKTSRSLEYFDIFLRSLNKLDCMAWLDGANHTSVQLTYVCLLLSKTPLSYNCPGLHAILFKVSLDLSLLLCCI